MKIWMANLKQYSGAVENPILRQQQSLACSSKMQTASSKELEKRLQGYWLFNSNEKTND